LKRDTYASHRTFNAHTKLCGISDEKQKKKLGATPRDNSNNNNNNNNNDNDNNNECSPCNVGGITRIAPDGKNEFFSKPLAEKKAGTRTYNNNTLYTEYIIYSFCPSVVRERITTRFCAARSH